MIWSASIGMVMGKLTCHNSLAFVVGEGSEESGEAVDGDSGETKRKDGLAGETDGCDGRPRQQGHGRWGKLKVARVWPIMITGRHDVM